MSAVPKQLPVRRQNDARGHEILNNRFFNKTDYIIPRAPEFVFVFLLHLRYNKQKDGRDQPCKNPK